MISDGLMISWNLQLLVFWIWKITIGFFWSNITCLIINFPDYFATIQRLTMILAWILNEAAEDTLGTHCDNETTNKIVCQLLVRKTSKTRTAERLRDHNSPCNDTENHKKKVNWFNLGTERIKIKLKFYIIKHQWRGAVESAICYC